MKEKEFYEDSNHFRYAWNLEALKATLKDIEKRKVDKIICLGDIIAKGVHPKECIELIREKCEMEHMEM